ncbi:Transcription repressor OFP8 [Euphorbia peplus]|nr:Transcription repressor OFP8 [Euphorbia peplus]
MENRFKIRISRIFRGSFSSCRTTAPDLSDVVETAVFLPQPQQHSYFRSPEPPSPPKPRPFSSICRPKFPEPTTNSIFPREKISSRYLKQVEPDRFEKKSNPKKKSKIKYQKKKITNNIYSRSNIFSSSSQDSAYFEGSYWFSSDEDEEDAALFSSRSTFSSDSSGSRRYRRKKSGSRRRKAVKNCEMEVFPVDGKVKDSFAVVKKSSDPYNDFRTSMVEMIIEKQIFAAYDLEELLQCFLSLNSDNHHRIIVEVFTEIYDALFSNWG